MYVVTGASGFVAGAVVETLVRRGLPVTAVSRRPAAVDPSVQAVVVKDYPELDVSSQGGILIHLAEPRDIGEADSSGETYVEGRTAALAALLAKGWEFVVYASSAAVYGDAETKPHRADEAVDPRGAYAQAKAMCERQVLARGGAVARLSNVYGFGMAPNNVISDILKQIPGEGPVTVRDRKPVRDYIWIGDAAVGLAQLALSRKPGIVNFGSGKGSSVEDVALLALLQAREKDRVVIGRADSEEASSLILDIGETTARLGWSPKVDLQQGLALLLGARHG